MRAVLIAATLGTIGWLGSNEAEAQIYFRSGNLGIGVGVGNGPSGAGFGYGPGVGGTYGGYMVPGYPYYGNGTPQYYRPHTHSHSYNNYYTPSYTPSYSQRQVIVNTVPVQPRGDGAPIRIENPADSGVTLTYSLNGHEYTIEPGHEQNLINDRNWVIEFDRGESFGTARYTLSGGIYTFTLTKGGWEAYHDADVSKLLKKNEPAASKPSTSKNPIPKSEPKEL